MSDLGTITPCYAITYERTSKHPPGRLWRAITSPDEVSRWMAYPARIDLRPGGEYHVDFSRTGQGELDGIVVRVEPERLLSYVWGLSVIAWRIEPGPDGGSRYEFVHHGQTPRLIPDEEGLAAGWHMWLDDFDAWLEGNEPSHDRREGWRELFPAYRARLAEVLDLD